MRLPPAPPTRRRWRSNGRETARAGGSEPGGGPALLFEEGWVWKKGAGARPRPLQDRPAQLGVWHQARAPRDGVEPSALLYFHGEPDARRARFALVRRAPRRRRRRRGRGGARGRRRDPGRARGDDEDDQPAATAAAARQGRQRRAPPRRSGRRGPPADKHALRLCVARGPTAVALARDRTARHVARPTARPRRTCSTTRTTTTAPPGAAARSAGGGAGSGAGGGDSARRPAARRRARVG